MRAVGYRQLWSYLDGEGTLDEAHEKALAATRQLAKRQLTWLRGWSELEWLLTDAAQHCIGAEETELSLGAQESSTQKRLQRP